MSAPVRSLPVTFDHNGLDDVGGVQLRAGEYLGHSEELGLELGGEIQWGKPQFFLEIYGTVTNITADVVFGRINVREVHIDPLASS